MVVNVINVLQFILRFFSTQLWNSFNLLIKMYSHTVSTFNPKAQQLQSQTHFRANCFYWDCMPFYLVHFLNFQINYRSNARKTILRGSKETGYNQATNFLLEVALLEQRHYGPRWYLHCLQTPSNPTEKSCHRLTNFYFTFFYCKLFCIRNVSAPDSCSWKERSTVLLESLWLKRVWWCI